jgi:Leucine-rich repeat (LRR) protein
MLLQDALRHVFASRITDIKDSPVWSKLSYVSCASIGIVLMDESLQLLPAIETLDLSRNKFAKVDNLRKCTKLRNLDLGFNHLRSISSLSEVIVFPFYNPLQNIATRSSLFWLHSFSGIYSYLLLSCRFPAEL